MQQTRSHCQCACCRSIGRQGVKGLMDQPQVYIPHAVNFQRLLLVFLPPPSHLCHAEINYFMSPNMQIILLNERCLTSQIQLICKCKWGFICDILYGWQKTKRLLNSNTNCSDWLSHIIIQSEYSKHRNSDWNEPEQHTHTRTNSMCLLVCFVHQIRFTLSKGTNGK